MPAVGSGVGLPSRTRREWVFRCGRPYFLVQKISDFSKFMVCPRGQAGRRPVQTFCE